MLNSKLASPVFLLVCCWVCVTYLSFDWLAQFMDRNDFKLAILMTTPLLPPQWCCVSLIMMTDDQNQFLSQQICNCKLNIILFFDKFTTNQDGSTNDNKLFQCTNQVQRLCLKSITDDYFLTHLNWLEAQKTLPFGRTSHT